MGTEDMQSLIKTVIAGIILVSLNTPVRTEPKSDDIHIHIHLDEMGEGESIKERGNNTLGSSKMKKSSKKSGDYSFMEGPKHGGIGKGYAESNLPTNEADDDDELPSPCKSRQTTNPGSCRDTYHDCQTEAVSKGQCDLTWAKAQCKKTCGHCGSSSPSTYSPIEPTGSPGGSCRRGEDECKNAKLDQHFEGVRLCCADDSCSDCSIRKRDDGGRDCICESSSPSTYSPVKPTG